MKFEVTKGKFFRDGKEIKMVVSVGDVILYSKYAGNEYKIDGQTYVIIRQSDVLAKVL